MKKYIFILLTVVGLVACSSESLSIKQAKSLIENHIEKYPYFEKTSFGLGERKFNMKKDSEEISILKSLEKQNLITLQVIDVHKKWLSKDSVWVVNIGLTANASNYVVDQKKNSADVKTYLFTVQENSDVTLELNSKTKATAKAKLIKAPTPFAGLSKDKNPNADFITQEFILKYNKETGWFVQK